MKQNLIPLSANLLTIPSADMCARTNKSDNITEFVSRH